MTLEEVRAKFPLGVKARIKSHPLVPAIKSHIAEKRSLYGTECDVRGVENYSDEFHKGVVVWLAMSFGETFWFLPEWLERADQDTDYLDAFRRKRDANLASVFC